MSTLQAWAVGIFEGEGYFDTHKNRVNLGIEMTDKDVLDRFATAFPGGTWYERQRKNCKKSWTYRLTKKALAIDCIKTMLPLLGDRRAHKALDILDDIECN